MYHMANVRSENIWSNYETRPLSLRPCVVTIKTVAHSRCWEDSHYYYVRILGSQWQLDLGEKNAAPPTADLATYLDINSTADGHLDLMAFSSAQMWSDGLCLIYLWYSLGLLVLFCTLCRPAAPTFGWYEGATQHLCAWQQFNFQIQLPGNSAWMATSKGKHVSTSDTAASLKEEFTVKLFQRVFLAWQQSSSLLWALYKMCHQGWCKRERLCKYALHTL